MQKYQIMKNQEKKKPGNCSNMQSDHMSKNQEELKEKKQLNDQKLELSDMDFRISVTVIQVNKWQESFAR